MPFGNILYYKKKNILLTRITTEKKSMKSLKMRQKYLKTYIENN